MIKKKKLCLAIAALFVATLFTSCKEDPKFDSKLLIGKWVRGTEYYRYDKGGTGATWDTGDDVQESEASKFTWEFDEETSDLTLIHQMEMGGQIPKYYKVKELTETKLKYKDKFDETYTYNRVK